jgi:Uma2 family endonuclease
LEFGCNGTVRLDLENDPQPDAAVFIDSGHGGQAVVSDDDFIEGAPELMADVSSGADWFDLGTKLNVYRRNGVREYVVWRVLNQEVDWFVLREGNYERLIPSADGLLKSEVFPGLWLNVPALLAGNMAAVLATVPKGLATAEHAAFVERLASSGTAKNAQD